MFEIKIISIGKYLRIWMKFQENTLILLHFWIHTNNYGNFKYKDNINLLKC